MYNDRCQDSVRCQDSSFTMSEKEGKSKGALGGLRCCQCPIYQLVVKEVPDL